jgi:hypothetical protein
MPNHESNYVVVVGDPDKVKRFFDEAFRDGNPEDHEPARVLDFNLIIPQPANIERGNCPGYHAEGVVCWHAWNSSNWGTKWGAYSHTEPQLAGNEGQAELRFTFDTAWTSPIPIFQKIEERWEVAVNAITIDEGGFPPVLYGTNVNDYLQINTNVEFA